MDRRACPARKREGRGKARWGELREGEARGEKIEEWGFSPQGMRLKFSGESGRL